LYLKKVTKELKMSRKAPTFYTYVVRIASKVGVDRLTMCYCRKFCQFIVHRKILSNRNPLSVCAAIIYIAQFLSSGRDTVEWSIEHISDVVHVAVPTIQKCIKKLLQVQEVVEYIQKRKEKWGDIYIANFKFIVS